MTNLLIRDLPDSKVLDTTSMHELKGGMYYSQSEGPPKNPYYYGIASANTDAYAYAIGLNGSYANTYTNAYAFKDPVYGVAVATATSNSVAVAY